MTPQFFHWLAFVISLARSIGKIFGLLVERFFLARFRWEERPPPHFWIQGGGFPLSRKNRRGAQQMRRAWWARGRGRWLPPPQASSRCRRGSSGGRTSRAGVTSGRTMPRIPLSTMVDPKRIHVYIHVLKIVTVVVPTKALKWP